MQINSGGLVYRDRVLRADMDRGRGRGGSWHLGPARISANSNLTVHDGHEGVGSQLSVGPAERCHPSQKIGTPK